MKVRNIGILLAIVTVFFMANAGLAQQEGNDGLRPDASLTVKPVYMNVYGADQFVLDEITYFSELKDNPDYLGGERDYGTNTNSEYAEPDWEFVPMIEGTYAITPSFRLKGNLWTYSTSTSKSNVFEAQSGERNSVYLWGGDYRLPFRRTFSLENDKHPSGYSPIDWDSEFDFDAWSGDLRAGYGVYRSDNAWLDFDFGLKLLRNKKELDRSVKMTAYNEDYDTGYDLKNDVTLSSTSEMEIDIGAGPSVGFSAACQLGQWTLSGRIGQALAYVDVDLEGSFHDVDDQKLVVQATGEEIGFERYDGRSQYDESKSTTIPVSTANMDIGYRFTDVFSMSVGAYWSKWYDVPGVATFNYRNLTWDQQEEDMTFAGANLGLTYRW